VLSRYARVYQWACRVPASVAAKLAGVRADSSIFYYLDGRYAASKNDLTHKSGFGVVQGH